MIYNYIIMSPNPFTGEPTEKERLKNEVEKLQRRLGEVNDAATNLRKTTEEQAAELTALRSVDRLNTLGALTMRQVMESDEARISAELDAEALVIEKADANARAILTSEVMDQKRAQWLESHMTGERREEIEAEVTAELERNGTFARLRKDARAEAAGVIRGELIEQKRAEAAQFVNSPAERARMIKEEGERLDAEGWTERAIVEARDAVREELREVAQQQAKGEINKRIESHRDNFIAAEKAR